MHWYWLICGVVMLLLEFIIPGLVICFFGVAALLVGGLIYFFPGVLLVWQLLIFAVAGAVLALLCRRLVPGGSKGTVKHQDDELDGDDSVGAICCCKEAITPEKPGKVEYHGSFWRAEAEVEIAAGELCIIEKRDNLTLKVRRK